MTQTNLAVNINEFTYTYGVIHMIEPELDKISEFKRGTPSITQWAKSICMNIILVSICTHIDLAIETYRFCSHFLCLDAYTPKENTF